MGAMSNAETRALWKSPVCLSMRCMYTLFVTACECTVLHSNWEVYTIEERY